MEKHNKRTLVLKPGAQFDRYTIIERLAQGGMAEVYLAAQNGLEHFEKVVVLKRILPQHAEQPEFVHMFLDEARLVANLNHPNIVQVYDIGCRRDNDYFFTMEYVYGRDVRQIRQRLRELGERLPLEHALAIVMGVAAALDAAHTAIGPDGKALNVVHRDISPANILVSFDGCIKLIDFGIAKADRRSTKTRTGVLKGKCCHMSPEQCLSDPLDSRSDIFCLGILLYELTVGARCFRAETEYETMRKIVAGQFTPPRKRDPDYPEALETMIMWAMERDPNDRYQSARQMYTDLERFARANHIPVGRYELAAYLRQLFPQGTDTANEEAAPRPQVLAPVPVKMPDPQAGGCIELGEAGSPSASATIRVRKTRASTMSVEQARATYDEAQQTTTNSSVHRHVIPRTETTGNPGRASTDARTLLAHKANSPRAAIPMRPQHDEEADDDAYVTSNSLDGRDTGARQRRTSASSLVITALVLASLGWGAGAVVGKFLAGRSAVAAQPESEPLMPRDGIDHAHAGLPNRPNQKR